MNLFGYNIGVFELLTIIGGVAGIIYFIRLASVATKTLVKLDTLMPVMFELAKQFKNDSGSSALDIIQHLQEASHAAAKAAEDSKRTVDDLQHSIDLLSTQQKRMEDTVQNATRTIEMTNNIISAMPESKLGQSAAGKDLAQSTPA